MGKAAIHRPGREPAIEPAGVAIARPADAASEGPAALDGQSEHLADPRAITILTTEHWSLLSSRGLVYNEAFSRGAMFLTFATGTFVALGLLSTATGFSRAFLAVTAIALALDLFVGVATMGRLIDVSREDLRCLQGMNRLRHAYHEMVPGLERYFVTSRFDDVAGVFGVYAAARLVSPSGFVHGLTTTIGMLGVINAALGAVLVGVLVLLAVDLPWAAVAGGLVAFVAAEAANLGLMAHQIGQVARSFDAAFPAPGARPMTGSSAAGQDRAE